MFRSSDNGGFSDQPSVSESFDARSMLEQFKNEQYIGRLNVLKTFGIPLDNVPTFKAIKAGMKPKVVASALKLVQPTLNLTPPQTLLEMLQAIDHEKGCDERIRSNLDVYEPGDDNLWNEGKSEENLHWHVDIVEGIQEVPYDKEIYLNGKAFPNDLRTNHDQVALWLKKYADQDLGVMSGARRYIALMMKGLAEGMPIDINSCTVLNPQTVSKDPSALLVCGNWCGDKVLSSAGPTTFSSGLRVRASVPVKL